MLFGGSAGAIRRPGQVVKIVWVDFSRRRLRFKIMTKDILRIGIVMQIFKIYSV